MIPNNYQCDGQMNFWDYIAITEVCKFSNHTCNKQELWKVAQMDGEKCPETCCRSCSVQFCGARCNGSEEPKHQEPDDSICEGCKWREHPERWLEVDEFGQTWVHSCKGTACANWTNGTALNLTAEEPSKEVVVWYEPEPKPYCFNRDWLPDLELIIEKITEWTGLKFTYFEEEYKGEPFAKGYRHKFKNSKLDLEDLIYKGTDKRFVSVSWDAKLEGRASPCDNFDDVLRAVNSAIERAKND